MADRYPAVLYNPQRPNSGFTEQSGGTVGNYLTPDGDYIFYDSLMEYIQTATGKPSASDVQRAQLALNNIYSSLGGVRTDGVFDPNTAARVAEFQLSNGMLPTGVPTGDVLAKLAGGTPTNANAGAQPKQKQDYGGALLALLMVVVAKIIED